MNKDWIGNKESLFAQVGASGHSKNNREKNDFYSTDPNSLEIFLKALKRDNIKLHNYIWECACGQGHLSKVLESKGYKVWSTDLIDRGYGKGNTDFLKSIPDEWCGDILTNPPYKYADEIYQIVYRITETEKIKIELILVPQDPELAKNQEEKIRCGDNGIFKGVPLTEEQKKLSEVARELYKTFNSDGKYILDENGNKMIICQSNAKNEVLKEIFDGQELNVIINPLGEWTGGTDVDTGATNRKLGSDMADSVTGGGLHGKDLSKADVSVNIYAFKKAQETGEPVELCCAIGDEEIDGKPYSEIVEIAREYIQKQGGFEKFAEWGLF